MSREPLAVGTHGKINTTAYLGDVKLVGEGKTWHTPDGEPVPIKQINWIARCRFRDNDGRTRPVEAHARSANKAESRLQDKLKERKRTASDTITADTRLEVLADYWLRTKIDAGKLATNTKQKYRDNVEVYIAPGLGGLRLRECAVSRLETWLQSLAQKTPANARSVRTCLIGMFDVAVREDALPGNPARSTTPIEPTEAADVRALEAEEVIKLRAALAEDAKASSQDLGDLVDVMLATGCRIGEALSLRWSEVDLDEHTVYLTGTVVREKGVGLFRQDTTKGKKPRGYLVPLFAVKMLERRAAETPTNDLDLVFPSARMTLREVSTIDKQWRAFRKQHPEWLWITPHTFRKSVATAIERGADIEAAAKQLGHSKSSMTAKHYVARLAVGPDRREILEQFSGE